MGAKALILLVFIVLSGATVIYYDAPRVLADWGSNVFLASSGAGTAGTPVSDGSGETAPAFSCNIWVERSSFNYERGFCGTYIAGPYLYSIEGLKTSFGLEGGWNASAMYIESFYAIGSELTPNPYWRSAGKKLTYSVVEGRTPELTGNSKVQLYFRVGFRYERFTYCGGYLGLCHDYHYLYPVAIYEIYRADQHPIGGSIEPYTPPSTAQNYATLGSGSASIVFIKIPGADRGSDTPLAGTSVNVSLSSEYKQWSAILTVHLYKDAVKIGDQYTTPYVAISAPNDFYYYWWFRDDDKMTYEILFKPYP